MRLLFYSVAFIISFQFSSAQNKAATAPKLVVGVVVDQMRYDYLTRFESRYGQGGFKRLIREGFNGKNNHFHYIPTYTAPGHASVHTGSSPSVHGIIGNNWFDKESGKTIYCVADSLYQTVGSESNAGQMSPHRLAVHTFSDQLRLHNQFRSRAFGVAIKDRGSILPAGFSGTAYWFDGDEQGKWISSTYYMQQLPKWVEDYNQSGKTKSFLKTWNTLYPVNTYLASGPDDNNYEGVFKGEEKPVFPHDLPNLTKENATYELIKNSAYGNDLTKDFALALLEKEKLGKGSATDFLAISFSSTDYLGHKYGPNSVEIEDTYLRLDKNIEELLNALDRQVGKGNYVIFLTADHGAVNVPAYLKDQKLAADYFYGKPFRDKLSAFATKRYRSDSLIRNISNGQIFLNHEWLHKNDLEKDDVEEAFVEFLLNQPEITEAYSATTLQNGQFSQGQVALLQRGYNQKRSGDVLFTLNPSTISYSPTGTTHGTGYNYDTHVPLLLYGWGVKPGETYQKTSIADIIPTLSALLGMTPPNGANGEIIEKAIKP